MWRNCWMCLNNTLIQYKKKPMASAWLGFVKNHKSAFMRSFEEEKKDIIFGRKVLLKLGKKLLYMFELHCFFHLICSMPKKERNVVKSYQGFDNLVVIDDSLMTPSILSCIVFKCILYLIFCITESVVQIKCRNCSEYQYEIEQR